MRGIRESLQLSWELYRLPEVTLQMAGDARARALYAAYTKRHPRLRVIQNKRWGVALLRIPDRFEDYIDNPARAHLRKEVRRALRSGYTFSHIDGPRFLEDILEIHRSSDERQGRPMSRDYFDAEAVDQNLKQAEVAFGVSDASGHVRAYFTVRYCGEVACGERILGHADHLRSGLMYLLISEAVREVTSRRQARGSPLWLYYDTFPGASQGMKDFKRWTGFEPYRVAWRWTEPSGDRS